MAAKPREERSRGIMAERGGRLRNKRIETGIGTDGGIVGVR